VDSLNWRYTHEHVELKKGRKLKPHENKWLHVNANEVIIIFCKLYVLENIFICLVMLCSQTLVYMCKTSQRFTFPQSYVMKTDNSRPFKNVRRFQFIFTACLINIVLTKDCKAQRTRIYNKHFGINIPNSCCTTILYCILYDFFFII